MPRQDITIRRNEYQNKILRLEKKYFDIIDNLIRSETFQTDLLTIEKEIRENYQEYNCVWDLKNKIKVPVERLIRHHIYMQLKDEIKGIYPSPISSDLGIRTTDVVLCIDAKTIDTYNNAGDLRATHVEENQNSFNNKNYPYIKTNSNLKSIDHYSRLPVLTYIIKVIYHDDNYSFKLERENYPSMVLVCIPNGEISHLFDYNIIDNFKTYNYYKESENEHFKRIPIPKGLSGILLEKTMDKLCFERGFSKIDKEVFSKLAYYDLQKGIVWWATSESNKKVLAPVKSGSSVRYNNEVLKVRYDDTNQRWNGYKEYQLPPQMK